MSNSSSTIAKNHSKKQNSSRDRDKNKSVASESGGSSQCDTPPLIEKDGPSQGKFAGVSADSIQCMAEQGGAEINSEAATNLAEDISYKLRQTISTIALHSEMMKKTCVDSWDVNTAFMLSDTSPVVGASVTQYVTLGEEKLCCEVVSIYGSRPFESGLIQFVLKFFEFSMSVVTTGHRPYSYSKESLINITEYAMTTQSYIFSTQPTVSVEWITDDKSLNNSNNISTNLHCYYTKIARAILNLKKKPKQIAVEDLTTNTRIGPIFPNLFNLAVLVLNDDNLNALNVPAKKPLQSNVLDMVDALCSNPCSLDTNIQQQFQRLFPVMVSNILGNGSLAEKMVAILTKITRTWPSFITIGKGILFDYLSQGTKERLTAPMIKCVMALGRHALVECLGDHLEFIDDCLHTHRRTHHINLRETILGASTCLLRSEPTTFLEDYVTTDYTLYEMLGDSIMPRRTLFPFKETTSNENASAESDEEFSYIPLRPVIRRPKVRLISHRKNTKNIHREALFEPTKTRKPIHIRIKNCRSVDVMKKPKIIHRNQSVHRSGVIVASGLLNRFRYGSNKSNSFPIFGALTL